MHSLGARLHLTLILAACGLLLAAGTAIAFPVVMWLEIRGQGYPGLPSVILATCLLLMVRGAMFLARSRGPMGIPVDSSSQPGLLKLIRETAGRLKVSPPVRVVLVPEASVAVLTRFWFFKPELVLGLALLEQVSAGQLVAVLACHLARLGGPSRAGSWVYSLSESLGRVLREKDSSLITMPFTMWARLIQRVAAPVCRQVKKDADIRAAAEVGKEVYTGSLQEAFSAAQKFLAFLHKEILMLLSAGGLPDNLYAGYRIWLARTVEQDTKDSHDAREDEMVKAMTSQKQLDGLPVQASMKAELEDRLRDLPVGPASLERCDPMPAGSLLVDIESLELAVTPHVTETFRRQGLFRLEQKPLSVAWKDVEGRIIVPQQKARAEYTLSTLGRLVNRRLDPQQGIDIYLSLLDVPELRTRLAGRLEPGMTRLPPALYPHVIQAILARFLGTLVGAALVENGGFRWEKPIARPLELVGQTGERLNPFTLAQGLLTGEFSILHFRMKLFEHGLFVSEK